MQNQRNLILAVVLSCLVFLGWTFLSSRYFPVAAPPSTKIVRGKQVALPTPESQADQPAKLRDRVAVLGETPRVQIVTPRVQGSINLKGARIDDLTLTDHRETIAKNSPPVRLFSPSDAPDAYFAQFGWSGSGAQLPDASTVWTADSNRLTPDKPVTLSWNNNKGQLFRITISIDRNYMFSVQQSVQNAGPSAIAVRPYGLISRVGPSKDPSIWNMHTGPIGSFGNGANYDVNFTNLDGQEPGFLARLGGTTARAGVNDYTATGGWLGFSDKYWLTALVPASGEAVQSRFESSGKNSYQADFSGAERIVASGKQVDVTSRLFAGAKEVSILDGYEKAGVPYFDRAIDWGWFVWFEKPIFYLLDWLFRHIGNFGVSIICLTIIVRALLFPVAQRQFSSMAAMRKVQPKMKVLQERHKEDKPRLQQEMMKLYQEEKINPLGGCLPIFVQLPIFVALYKVLSLSIEMRHQPFVLWIRDLSSPDPLTPVNLFGLLPFNPPPMLHLGLLAIMLGVTMWATMRLSPQTMDPSQQQVMQFMPWLMMLFFAPLAAGLQLYYVANNLLTLLQQQLLYARTPGLKDDPKK